MGITLKDVAAKLNLSVTTVSLVLNGKATHLPKTTRDRVKRVAEEMNYRPNQLAVGLITKKTKTLGLLIPDIQNDFFAALAKGVEEEARHNGWTIILCNTADDHEREMDYIDLLASKRVDGILYCMSINTDIQRFQKIHAHLTSYNLPYMMLDRFYQTDGVQTALLDHFQGGYLATKHLLSLGHRAIACVTGPKHSEDSKDRLNGYRKALAEHGLSYDPSFIIEGDYHIESGIKAIDQLEEKAFTAVFAFNDLMAFGVCHALMERQLHIPEDISVIGYDDIFFSKMFEVPLTTISQPVVPLGRAATKELIDHFEEDRPLESVKVYPPTLIVRRSTAKHKEDRPLSSSMH